MCECGEERERKRKEKEKRERKREVRCEEMQRETTFPARSSSLSLGAYAVGRTLLYQVGLGPEIAERIKHRDWNAALPGTSVKPAIQRLGRAQRVSRGRYTRALGSGRRRPLRGPVLKKEAHRPLQIPCCRLWRQERR